MASSQSNTKYSTLAVAFHWALALLIFILLPLGVYMHEQEMSPEVAKLYALHKSLGITVLSLAMLRIVWRLFNPPPPLPADMPPMQVFATHAVHALLYVAMLAIPVTGWIGSSSGGYPVTPFGLFVLPDLVGKNHDLHELMEELHEFFSIGLAGLIVLHIAATIVHQFIKKDNLLARMSFFGPRRIG